MTRTWTCLIPLAMLATQCIADDALNVQVPAGLAKDARMLDVVKEQCSLPEVVGENIFSAVSQVYSNSKKVDSEASVIGEAFLKITILSAQE